MKTEIYKENNIINRIILTFMKFCISKHIRKWKVKPQSRQNYLKFILQQIIWILDIYRKVKKKNPIKIEENIWIDISSQKTFKWKTN